MPFQGVRLGEYQTHRKSADGPRMLAVLSPIVRTLVWGDLDPGRRGVGNTKRWRMVHGSALAPVEL